jgi:hypothetical protein
MICLRDVLASIGARRAVCSHLHLLALSSTVTTGPITFVWWKGGMVLPLVFIDSIGCLHQQVGTVVVLSPMYLGHTSNEHLQCKSGLLRLFLTSAFGNKLGSCFSLHPLAADGTQRPLDPFTLQTSCFKLVFGVQHAPFGTGRPAFWGCGVAYAIDARESIRERENFISSEVIEVGGLREKGSQSMRIVL